MSDIRSDEIRRVRREYYRNWRKKNPDKVKATLERYWLRKLEEQKRAVPGVPEKTEVRKPTRTNRDVKKKGGLPWEQSKDLRSYGMNELRRSASWELT